MRPVGGVIEKTGCYYVMAVTWGKSNGTKRISLSRLNV